PATTTNIVETGTTEKPETKRAETKRSEEKPDLAKGDFVSRAEYERLKSEHEALKQELADVKAFVKMGRKGDGVAAPAQAGAPTQESSEEPMEDELDELRSQVGAMAPGSTRHLLSGFASASFTSRRHEDAAFSANFSPLFLWQLNERILFEGELDLTLEDSETELD